MKKLAITTLILVAAFSAFAQRSRTVTNQDLEKFRQQRLTAERDLKEKYAALGTTPEEVERQSRERRAELEEYSTQLQIWRIMAQNERIAQENARREYEQGSDQPGLVYFYGGGVPYIGYYPYGWNRKNSVLRNLRNLPPNMRTVQEYALAYPNTRSIFNAPRRFIPRRSGGWRGSNPSPRPRISIRFGFGRRGF